MKDESSAKGFFKHFAVLIIITVAVVGVTAFFVYKKLNQPAPVLYESPNTERVYGDQRVFDFADRLTDSEEKKLEAYIHEKEYLTSSDIVIVLIAESLEGYAADYEARYGITEPPEKWVMLYADEFYEVNRFGYDQPQILNGQADSGDGILLIDNDYRERSGYKYTWVSTTGKCYYSFDSDDVQNSQDIFYRNVDKDLYQACIDFVDYFVYCAAPTTPYVDFTPSLIPVVVALVCALIYLGVNMSGKVGKKTTVASTYLDDGAAEFLVNENTFIRKTLTQRTIETSSSSGGGGGGHVSGGGGFHGGGGHSR
jgi:uncharacterized protein